MALNKAFSFCLIALLASGVLFGCLGTVNAEVAIPKPSVPEFTVQLTGPAFTKNTTYILNSETGQIEAQLGYTNQYSYVTLLIKNQHFDSNYGSLYYDVKIKDHTAQGWRSFYYDGPNPNVQSTTSDFTNFTILIENYGLNGTETDIQVQAMLGSYSYGRDMSSPLPLGGYSFSGATSGWSSTQTIRVPANVQLTPTQAPQSSTATPTSSATIVQGPTSTPTSDSPTFFVLDFGEIVIIALLVVVAVLLGLVVVYLRRRGVKVVS